MDLDLEKCRAALTAAQKTALEAICAGKGFTAVAEAAGVDIFTVLRWKESDRNFIAVYESWRRNLIPNVQKAMLALRAQLLASRPLLLANLTKAIESGELKLTKRQQKQYDQLRATLEAEKKAAARTARTSSPPGHRE
jgi:hypothetical protein